MTPAEISEWKATIESAFTWPTTAKIVAFGELQGRTYLAIIDPELDQDAIAEIHYCVRTQLPGVIADIHERHDQLPDQITWHDIPPQPSTNVVSAKVGGREDG